MEDEKGILGLQSRIDDASLTEEFKKSILIPKESGLVKLLVRKTREFPREYTGRLLPVTPLQETEWPRLPSYPDPFILR